MKIEVFDSKQEIGRAAAAQAASIIGRAIEERGQACLIARDWRVAV
jgi:hypothetical protein